MDSGAYSPICGEKWKKVAYCGRMYFLG